jgi:hypothetical protein
MHFAYMRLQPVPFSGVFAQSKFWPHNRQLDFGALSL